MTESQPQQLSLQRIYLKDVSFEVPNSISIFQSDWQPTVDIQLNVQNKLLETNHYEVVLRITITVNSAEKVAYLLEVQQAGLFVISGIPGEALGRLLAAYCPSILFPYAREAISDLVGKGSFPQLLLAPVNFDLLFDEAMERQAGETLQ